MFREVIENRLPDYLASYENHCNNNTFIRLNYKETELEMISCGYTPIGICTPPYFCVNSKDIALIFETKEYEKKWCHISNSILRGWKRQLEVSSL